MAFHEGLQAWVEANPGAVRAASVALLWVVTLVVVRYNDRFYKVVADRAKGFSPDARTLHHINRLSDMFIVFIALMLTLAFLGVGQALWGALTALGVAGIVIAFATKDIASNFISGFIILFDRPFAPGDFVEVGSLMGTVEAVRLRSSTLKTADGLRLVVPNTEFITKPVKNYSVNPERRIDVVVALAHENDLDRAFATLKEEAEAIPERLTDRPVEVHLTELQEYRVMLRVRVWVERPSFLVAKSELQKRVTRRFIAEGIELAVPLRKTVTSIGPGGADTVIVPSEPEEPAP